MRPRWAGLEGDRDAQHSGRFLTMLEEFLRVGEHGTDVDQGGARMSEGQHLEWKTSWHDGHLKDGVRIRQRGWRCP